MNFGRLNHVAVAAFPDTSSIDAKGPTRLLILAALALASACKEEQPQHPPRSTELADILRDPDSRDLSDRLGLWLESRQGEPQRIDTELSAQGFRRLAAAEGCTRHGFQGEPERKYFVDATLRIEIKQCGAKKRKRWISVTRGRS